MRNKILFLLTAAIFSIPAMSQQVTEGSLECLKNEHNLNLTIDYSEAIIHYMTETAFADFSVFVRVVCVVLLFYNVSRFCVTLRIRKTEEL